MEEAAVAGRHEVQHGRGEVAGGRRGTHLVDHHRQRVAVEQPIRGSDDPGREVRTRMPIEPRRTDDPQPGRGTERPTRGILSSEFADAVRVPRPGRVRLVVSRPSVRSPGKTSLVETSSNAVPVATQATGQRVSGIPVPPHRERGVPRTSIDVGPGRAVNDYRWTVALEQPGWIRCIEVELRSRPRDDDQVRLPRQLRHDL